jgi:polyvinyl alcohol dehydrogenase (cytochrome)
MARTLLATALGCASLLALASCQTPAPAEPAAVAQVAQVAPSARPTPPASAPTPPRAPIAAPQAPAPQPVSASNAAANAAGETLYQANCAMCHDHTDTTRAPAKDALKAMSFQFVNYTLTSGKMKDMGAKLSPEDRGTLVSYLTGRGGQANDEWAKAAMCPADRRAVNLSGQVVSSFFGFDGNNTRALTAKKAGLTKAQLSNLDLAWTIGFPDVAEMRSTGAIIGATLFFPVAPTGQMYAIDLAGAKPCFKWIYTAPGGAPLRSSVAYGTRADGTAMLVFSGLDSTVHAVDPKTGKAFWTKGVGSYSYSMTSGTPTILKDRVIIPVSQFEISVAADNKLPCCNNHGYVLSLDPKTGAQQWRYDTMEDAKPLRDRGDGKPYFGPSGAPIWNSPVVDEKRGLIYFGTGEANSEPTHRNTDALIAISLKDGKEKWSMQATGRDIFVSGCGLNPAPARLNCSKDTVFRDVDFGASLILGKLKNGKELLYAGQKSGEAWALEPDTGKVIWSHKIGTGSALGGIHWGMAYDNDTLYVPISNIGQPLPGGPPIDPSLKSGIYALNAATGEIKWMFSPPPPEAPAAAPTPPPAASTPPGPPGGRPGARSPRNSAMSAAIAVIDGVVIAGALDGTLYAIDATTGKQLWSFKTATNFEGAVGVPAKGGSIDSNSITAGNGMLLVSSGYGQFGEIPGNVLMAFKPKPN